MKFVSSRAFGAGSLYFAIVFLVGFLLGTLRSLILEPIFGEAFAVGIELPVMLIVCWFACIWVVQRYRGASCYSERALMGAIAFVMLIAAEVLLSVLMFGRSIGGHFQNYEDAPAFMGLAAQVAFGLFPLLTLYLQQDIADADMGDGPC